MTTTTRSALLAAAVSLASVPLTARADRFQLDAAATTRWLQSPSIDALSADDLHPFTELGVGVRVGQLPLLGGLDVSLQGTWQVGVLEGTSFQRVTSKTRIDSWQLSGRAERQLATRLLGYGRAGLGITRVDLTLEDQFLAAAPLADTGYTASGLLSGGLEVDVVRFKHEDGRRKAAIALNLELGYALARPLELEAKPSASADGRLRIPTEAASLGELELSGWSLRLGLGGRF